MNDKKGWGTTVLGWFIEKDEQRLAEQSTDPTAVETLDLASYDQPLAASSEEVAPEEGASPGESPSSAPQKELPRAVGGKVDFDAVFESAGVDADERGRVAKAVSLLHSLPAETEVTVKKQIVEASLKAFGVPIEQIIEAGAAEIQALEFYIRGGKTDTEKLLQESAERIRLYEEEIANIRRVMADRVSEQEAVVRSCNEKKLEVQQILEFFGRERVASVVKASPKLHDPTELNSPAG